MRHGGLDHGINTLSVEVLSVKSDIEAMATEIEQFLMNDAVDCAFQQNPHVLLAEHRRNSRLKPLIIVIRDKGRIVCTASGYITYRPFNLAISIFQIPGPYLNVIVFPLNGLSISKFSDESDVLDAFFLVLKSFRKEFDIVYLDQIEMSSPLWKYANNKSRSRNFFFQLSQVSVKTEINSCHVLKMSYDDWYGSFGRKTKKRISWELSRFNKNAPQPVLVERIDTENQVSRFLKNVEKIREDMWQTKTFGYKEACLPDNIEYFKIIAHRGWLRSYILTCDGKPAAYEMAVQYGGGVTFLERGYVQSMGNIGPGTYLTYFIMKDCYENNPPVRINFGYGENEFKKRLRTSTSDACCAYLTMPNKGRLLVISQHILNFIEMQISRVLSKTGLDQKVRRYLKRKK